MTLNGLQAHAGRRRISSSRCVGGGALGRHRRKLHAPQQENPRWRRPKPGANQAQIRRKLHGIDVPPKYERFHITAGEMAFKGATFHEGKPPWEHHEGSSPFARTIESKERPCGRGCRDAFFLSRRGFRRYRSGTNGPEERKRAAEQPLHHRPCRRQKSYLSLSSSSSSNRSQSSSDFLWL